MATILVVDDSAVSRHLLGFVLKRENHVVLAAASGTEALETLATTPVDLVIADLAMPEMDGLALLSAMRSQARLRNIQLMMLTSSGQSCDRQRAEATGVSSFLTKPASSRDLVEAVNRLLLACEHSS